jgi:hypothetical protein
MPYHVPFIDQDISDANRVTAAWLNGVNDLVYGNGNAAAGAALLQYIAGMTGAATRTAQNKMREMVTVTDVKDSGVVTTADIQKALDFVSSGGGLVRIPNGVDVLIDGDLSVPANCALSADKAPLGSITPADMAAFRPRVYVASSATIELNNASALTNLMLLRQGLTFNITSAQVAAQFLGTAITLNDSTTDICIENCAVLGFAKGISGVGTNIARVRLSRLNMDNIAGIDLGIALDSNYIQEIHCWPFVTVNSTPEAGDAQLKRSGAALQIVGTNDWAHLTNVFSFGYFRGMRLGTTGQTVLVGCGNDYPALSASDGSIGLLIDGASTEIVSVAQQCAGVDNGVYANMTGSNARLTLVAPSLWENFSNAVVNERGIVDIIHPKLRKTGGTGTGVATVATSTSTHLSGGFVNGFAAGGSNASSSTKLYVNGTDFTGCTTPIVNPYKPSAASATTLVVDGISSVIEVTGTTTMQSISPASPYAGKTLTLYFTAALTVLGTVGNISLGGNYVTEAGSTLTLYCDGTSFFRLDPEFLNSGVVTDTTDGSGDVTVTHGLGVAPEQIYIQLSGASSVAVWQPHSVSTTIFKVRFWSIPSGPGAPLTGTSVTFSWQARVAL